MEDGEEEESELKFLDFEILWHLAHAPKVGMLLIVDVVAFSLSRSVSSVSSSIWFIGEAEAHVH